MAPTPSVLRELRDSEVENLHVAVVADHDVLWLDVSMDDAGFMRNGERARRLRSDLRDRSWPVRVRCRAAGECVP